MLRASLLEPTHADTVSRSFENLATATPSA
jgi:hypothetical protein